MKDTTLIFAFICLVTYIIIRGVTAKLFLSFFDSVATGLIGSILWTVFVDRKHTDEIRRLTRENESLQKRLLKKDNKSNKIKIRS